MSDVHAFVEVVARWAFTHQFASGLIIGTLAGMLLEKIHVLMTQREGEK